MFGRAVLPLLRQRSLATSSRLGFTGTQIRSYAKARKGGDYPLPETAQKPSWQTSQGQTGSRLSDTSPIRPVPASPSERIIPQTTERASSLGNPIAAPEVKRPAAAAFAPSAAARPAPESTVRSTPPASTPRTDSPAADVSQAEIEVEQTPTQPLPDLTKGIPSTLAAELGQAEKAQSAAEDKMNITEDPESPPPGPGGRGRGELPKSAYISSSDRKRSTMLKFLYLGLTLGSFSYLLYLGRNWDSEEEEKQHTNAPNGYTPGAMYDRMRARLGHTVSYYSDPVAAKLLEDPNPDPNLRYPFTLVISLEDMLVHSEWTRQNGYRIAKRPGFDYFVRYLSQYYELVLFTSQPEGIASQIVRKLDPFGLLIPLFREHTLYADGGYVKDLSYLNRDLKKVLVIDTDPHHVKNQPENAILLPKWTGDPNDQTLIQFIPFLEYLVMMNFDDARAVLKSFEGKYIPAEFAKREQAIRAKVEKSQGKKSSVGVSSLFGTKKAGVEGASSDMLFDQFRAAGQKQYQDLNRRLEVEGPKWLAEQAEMDKKLQEEHMQNMKSGMFSWFGPSSPAPSSSQAK